MRPSHQERTDVDWFERLIAWGLGVIITGLLIGVGYLIWFEVNDPGHGTITGKEHHAAYMSCGGKPMICTWHEECYSIDYTDGHNDGDACVSPAEYERYEVGGQYPAKVPS